MGCGDSRPKNVSDDFNTLSLAFTGGRNAEPNLGPIDSYDFKFRQHFDEKTYGSWEDRRIELDSDL